MGVECINTFSLRPVELDGGDMACSYGAEISTRSRTVPSGS